MLKNIKLRTMVKFTKYSMPVMTMTVMMGVNKAIHLYAPMIEQIKKTLC